MPNLFLGKKVTHATDTFEVVGELQAKDGSIPLVAFKCERTGAIEFYDPELVFEDTWRPGVPS